MASGSGKNQDDTGAKEPADLPREDADEESSNGADSVAAAAAAATEPPLSALPSESSQEGAHGSPESGGRDHSPAMAAAAERKGEETMASAPAGGKPSLPPRLASVSTAMDPSSGSGKAQLPPRPTSREEVVASGSMAEKAKGKTSKGMDPKSEAEQMPRKSKGQVKSWLEKVQNKQIWRKAVDRIGNSNGNHTILNPHVSYQKVHMAGIIRHYNLLGKFAEQGVEVHSYVMNLCRAYSEFRPVHGDGECFYRSFIFSYLEQVLDRQDTHEEHRLLAAVKRVSRQHARLGWASEFSRSHKAFKKLIKNVMRWKTHSGLKHVPTINSYHTEKLLEFFSFYDKANDIFTFLRLVAAIWICSHSEEFEPLIPELSEVYTLTDWCFKEVIQRKVFTDHIQITALVRALGVPLRVEYLFQEVGQDLYTGQSSEDDISMCICLPHHHHVLPPSHQVPRVTVLYSDEHYDVIYPYCADDQVLLTDVRSSQQSDKVECPTASRTRSPSQYQGGSCSDEKSSQQIDWIGHNSTDEESNQQLPLPDELLWDIFLQLPVADIRRCLSVCRQFRDLIRLERFQHQHGQIWSPRILIYHKPDIKAKDGVIIYDEVPHEIEGFNVTTREVSPLFHLTCFPYSFDDAMGIRIQGSCDGMILLSFEEELCVWNPWTGWWGNLAPIHLENVIVAFYAHLQSPQESAKDYCILCRTSIQDTQGSYWIINLGKAGFNAAREIGRPMVPGSPVQLDKDLQELPCAYYGPPTVINGFLVWLLPPFAQGNYLITFNTMLEMFGVIDIPDTDLLPYQLLQVEDRIAIAFLSRTMDYVDVWVLLNSKDRWVLVHNVDLPISEVQAMRGIDRFGEPFIYMVPESLDILIWTPEFLIVVDPSGLVQEYHQHHRGWIMLPPHVLKVRFEEQIFSGPEDVVPPFFQFPEVVCPGDFTQNTTESGMDDVSRLPETSSTGERSNQQTVQGGKLSSYLSGRG